MLFDTSILIDFLRKGVLNNLEISGSISVVTLIEILRGIQSEGKRRKVKHILEKVFHVYDIDNRVVLEYCNLYTILRQRGRVLSDNDLIIAATARAHGEVLVTKDKAFNILNELNLLDVIVVN